MDDDTLHSNLRNLRKLLGSLYLDSMFRPMKCENERTAYWRWVKADVILVAAPLESRKGTIWFEVIKYNIPFDQLRESKDLLLYFLEMKEELGSRRHVLGTFLFRSNWDNLIFLDIFL